MVAIAIFGLGVNNSNAQSINLDNVKFGAKAGLNVANISNAKEYGFELGTKLGYHLGIMGELKLTNKFALQPEILFSTQGASKTVEGGTISLNTNYLTIPMMAKYHIAEVEGLSLEAGLQLGILMSAKINVKGKDEEGKFSETEDVKEKVKAIDFGLNIGAGYTLNNMNIGLRYNLGLINIPKNNTNKSVKNGVFQISVGYFFN